MATTLTAAVGLHDTYHGGSTSIDRKGPDLSPSNSSGSNKNKYLICWAGGAVASTARWLFIPLEVAKTNMQVHPATYTSISTGFRLLYKQDGILGLYKGFIPSAMAYGLQKAFKFSVYEYLKDSLFLVQQRQQPQNLANATLPGHTQQHNHRSLLVYMAAAVVAEAVADIFMAPWEIVKVRVQTNSLPASTHRALQLVLAQPRQYNFPFGNLTAVMSRQIPATVANIVAFEYSMAFLSAHLLPLMTISPSHLQQQSLDGQSNQRQQQQQQQQPLQHHQTRPVSGSERVLITSLAGAMAGLACAVCSHPMDSLVSLRASAQYEGWTLYQIIRHVGVYRLATRGLGPRLALVGPVVAGQWILYDAFKTIMRVPTTTH